MLVLGGGFGGLESAFYLRAKLGARVNLTLISDQDHFLYKPDTILYSVRTRSGEAQDPPGWPHRQKDIPFVQAKADEIDPHAKTVTAGGGKHRYDHLIVATGSGMPKLMAA